MSKKSTYKVNTAMNFSIGADEFYLTKGDVVELPEHELVQSLLLRKHISKVVKAEAKVEVKAEVTEVAEAPVKVHRQKREKNINEKNS